MNNKKQNLANSQISILFVKTKTKTYFCPLGASSRDQ